MIIKSKRVRARGAALKRLLRHVMDGKDNDLVQHLQGNIADLEDARKDALRFGREYSVRHWILSPESEITPAQLAYLIALLAVEFRFDPKLAVVWKHHKDRAVGACDQHFHVLVREVDAVDGSVMTSSHNFRVHEKLARQVEVAWGHKLTRGAHNRAVASTLKGGENDNVVTAMTDAGLLDAPKTAESFAEEDHQRAKREGVDLPRLRVMISDVLSESQSRIDFEARLAAIGLRIRRGEKADTPIIETLDNILVGSLARLTRLRKAALLERLKFNVAKQHAVETHRSSGDVQTTRPAQEGDGPNREAGGAERSSGSTAPNGGRDRTSQSPDGRRGADSGALGDTGVPAGRSSSDESVEGRRSQLIFTLGCSVQQGALLDLLAIARRTAQPPLERVISDIDEIIETNTSWIGQQQELAEPRSLVAARNTEREIRLRVRALEAESNAVLEKLAAFPPPTAWRRFWYRRETKARLALQVDLSKKQGLVQRVGREHVWSQHQLDTEIKSFKSARAKHCREVLQRTERAKQEMKIAGGAKMFVQNTPQFATWGAPRLMQVAARIEQTRLKLAASTEEDLELQKNSSTTP